MSTTRDGVRDMTAPLLIAPQDRRSLIWDVTRDCRTKQAARELAARIIPASQLIGEQEIEREEKSETVVAGKCSVKTTRRRDIRRVITADEIATRLGPRGNHIRVLMLGLGADALELWVPFVTLPAVRPGHVPADWATRAPERVEPGAGQTARILNLPTLSKGAADRIREIGE